MKITKNHTVFQLAFMPRLFPVNCYFVEEENELTLIDAALPYSTKSIIDTAKKLGKPISNIILTHAHDDHVGALDELKKLLPTAQISISARDSKLLAGDANLLPHEKNIPIRGGIPKKIETRPDILLKEGERIGSLEVIDSPGHTPGSITLLDTRNQSLIVGDAFQTRGGIAVSGKLRPLFPFPAFSTWDKMMALETAKKLLSYQPRLLATGHGKMIENPIELMKQAITHAEKRLGF